MRIGTDKDTDRERGGNGRVERDGDRYADVNVDRNSGGYEDKDADRSGGRGIGASGGRGAAKNRRTASEGTVSSNVARRKPANWQETKKNEARHCCVR